MSTVPPISTAQFGYLPSNLQTFVDPIALCVSKTRLPRLVLPPFLHPVTALQISLHIQTLTGLVVVHLGTVCFRFRCRYSIPSLIYTILVLFYFSCELAKHERRSSPPVLRLGGPSPCLRVALRPRILNRPSDNDNIALTMDRRAMVNRVRATTTAPAIAIAITMPTELPPR